MSYKIVMKNVKKRYWAMVLYPESAPPDWREKLQATGIQCAISPLHNQDVNPDNTKKKEHYHIILCYEGPTTFNNVNSLCESLNQPIPQPLEQLRGYYRYLVHKDNPEKYQYSQDLITTLNGFDVNNYLELTNDQVLSGMKVLVQLINDNDIFEYCDLINMVNEMDRIYYDLAFKHTFFLTSYIRSFRQKHLQNLQR